MDRAEIKVGVERAVRRRGLVLTQGAMNAVVQMILNIVEDPSPSWRVAGRVEKYQQQVIDMLPDILTDLQRNQRRGLSGRLTSWEIWHNVSELLAQHCPIPKDI